jgi:uncharacterized repeat protein (TIGR03803 family)
MDRKRRLVSLSGLALTMLSTLLLIAARPAQAQSETVIFSFNANDGSYPQSSLIFDTSGNLYGAASDGAGYHNAGNVFELSPNGNGGWNQTVLYTFTGGADGEFPTCNLIFDSAGNLYGTTQGGGSTRGVVFELSPVGGTWKETVLYSFTGGTDGDTPVSGLIVDSAGNLYGTTLNGGTNNNGTVFELSPSANGWKEQVIYDVDTSFAGLTMDAAGNIFGAGLNSVFELSPNGKGGWNPKVLHAFGTGGQKYLYGLQGTPVLDKSGNVYGTRYGGGGVGQVFKLSRGTTGKWKMQVLQSFTNFTGPWAGIVFDKAGNIYGTTYHGGDYGYGIVFELVAPVGQGSYTEKVLWNFTGTDGQYPSSVILDTAGNLYGTAQRGGDQGGWGAVFEVIP